MSIFAPFGGGGFAPTNQNTAIKKALQPQHTPYEAPEAHPGAGGVSGGAIGSGGGSILSYHPSSGSPSAGIWAGPNSTWNDHPSASDFYTRKGSNAVDSMGQVVGHYDAQNKLVYNAGMGPGAAGSGQLPPWMQKSPQGPMTGNPGQGTYTPISQVPLPPGMPQTPPITTMPIPHAPIPMDPQQRVLSYGPAGRDFGMTPEDGGQKLALLKALASGAVTGAGAMNGAPTGAMAPPAAAPPPMGGVAPSRPPSAPPGQGGDLPPQAAPPAQANAQAGAKGNYGLVGGYDQGKMNDLSYHSPKYDLGRLTADIGVQRLMTPEGQAELQQKLAANPYYKNVQVKGDKITYTGQHGQPVTIDYIKGSKSSHPELGYLTSDHAGGGGQAGPIQSALGGGSGAGGAYSPNFAGNVPFAGSQWLQQLLAGLGIKL